MKGRRPNEITAGTATLTDAPKPPAWLSKDAKAEWRRVAPILVERAVLTEADLGILESYVVAIARVREAERTIARDGATITNAKGEFKRHPAVTSQDAAIKTARLCANELGLTPVSRSRPTIRATSDEDDLSPLDI